MINLIQGDCLIEMDKLIVEGVKVDLTVTSPPYDSLRTYEGSLQWNEKIWKQVIEKLYNITADGGVVVWVVGDSTVKGSETGTSFKQALYFKEVGFNLHDTMIYTKGGQGATGSNLAYWQDFEYMFIFTKNKIRVFNPINDRKNKVKPRIKTESQGHRHSNGEVKGKRVIERKEFGKRFNIWVYHESGTRSEHPAVFPEQLAQDHIISWSNEGNIVFDPFMGSGTTGKIAKKLNRDFIGIEKVGKYFEIAKSRIEKSESILFY